MADPDKVVTVVTHPVKEGIITERGTIKAYHVMELYGFSFPPWKKTRYSPGPKLRFSIGLRLDILPVNPDIGDEPRVLAFYLEGCIARRNREGKITWMPPQARYGSFWRNIAWVSRDFYDQVLEAIETSPYAAKLVYDPVPKTELACLSDPSLPERILL